jgi:hypothetical protein
MLAKGLSIKTDGKIIVPVVLFTQFPIRKGQYNL